MKIEQLKTFVIDALNEAKANDVTVIPVSELTSLTDIMIVCSGRSTRHVTSIAQSLVTAAKKQHLKYINMEGETVGEWVIVDLADIVVHVMTPTTREFYNLEDLWEPVKKQRASQKE